MSIWRFLKELWMGSRKKKRYSSILGDLLHLEPTSSRVASQQKHHRQKRASDSHAASLFRDSVDDRYQLWIELSPREQDVTALVCLRYTNPQIAARLGLSTGTVKSYVGNVLNKLGFHNKGDLRVFFADWDFSEFERRDDPHR